MFPYIIQGSNIVVVIRNKTHTVNRSHVAYEKLKQAIKDNDWTTVEDIIEPKKMILSYGQGNVAVQGDKLFWRGIEMNNSLATRMISMLQEGFSIEPMVNFMDNLMSNPSKRSVDELYRFLEKNNLPVTPDGCFLAYKRVRADWFDVHSGTVLNKPAHLMTPKERAGYTTVNGVTVAVENDVTVISMPRNFVDDVADRTCSTGLHFCSEGYLNHFGGEKVLILKINPRDCVSIPTDYDFSKGRCCRYEIQGELGVDPTEAFTQTVQETANTAV